MIRLQRAGKKNRPDFRIVLTEKENAASKKITEVLGHYNPHTKSFAIKQERLQYWISQHVSLSPTVHNLFVNQKLITDPKVKSFSIPAKPAEPESKPGPASAETAAAPAEAEPVAAAEAAPAPAEQTAQSAPEAPAEPQADSTPAETATAPAAEETAQ